MRADVALWQAAFKITHTHTHTFLARPSGFLRPSINNRANTGRTQSYRMA